jgi:hypothetical protein
MFFFILFLPHALQERGNVPPRISAAPEIGMARENYYDRGHHEAASKFLGQEAASAKY